MRLGSLGLLPAEAKISRFGRDSVSFLPGSHGGWELQVYLKIGLRSQRVGVPNLDRGSPS